MSGNHALRERAELLAELRDIVQAMKNVAFAELQRVSRELPALAEARDAVLRSVSRLPPPDDERRAAVRPTAWLVIGAERGFCGAFNAHLADEVGQLLSAEPKPTVLVASQRLHEFLGPEATATMALPGCSAVEDSTKVLESWLDVLASFTALPAADIRLLHHGASGVQRSRLWPVATATERTVACASRVRPWDLPLHHLPWAALREALQRQALQLLLQSALCDSLAQENRSRLAQMQLAQDHLDGLGRALRRRRSMLRQAEITNELETLISALPSDDTIPRKAASSTEPAHPQGPA